MGQQTVAVLLDIGRDNLVCRGEIAVELALAHAPLFFLRVLPYVRPERAEQFEGGNFLNSLLYRHLV
jgi:hypothetical protein